MASKIKGIYKGFKSISHIFVVKEREMEIGQPTDVKHVAHVGVSHSSTVSPSWMNEFRFGPDTTTASTDNSNISHPTTPSIDNTNISHLTTLSKRSSKGLDQSIESQPATKKTRNRSCTDLSNVTKKRKRRKKKNSVAESSSTRSRRISRTKETSTQLSLSPDIEI